MNNETRLHHASCVFLARLLMVHGTEACDFLRRLADELDGLADELASDERSGGRLLRPDA